MKKWIIAFIVFALLASMVSVASADPGNGPNAYTMTVDCVQEGNVTIQVLNDHSPASFRLGEVHGDVGIIKAIYMKDSEGDWILLYSVPGIGVYERTETCYWDNNTFKAEVLIPHE